MADDTPEAVSKRTRFEVFKRDSFKCQYCGRAAPEAILHVDHIKPKSKGGTATIDNLITACDTCNLGKGAVPLDDRSVIERQRKQLEKLNERRQQLEMMLQWREELAGLKDREVDIARQHFEATAPGFFVSESGQSEIKRWLKKFGLQLLLEAIDTSAHYLRFDQKKKATRESWETAFLKIPGIAFQTKQAAENPQLAEIYYTRNIVRKAYGYVSEGELISLVKQAAALGIDHETVRGLTHEYHSWSRFADALEDLIRAAEKDR